MKEGLTDAQRAAIVTEALGLIAQPDNFTQGTWKCQLYRDSEGHLIPWGSDVEPKSYGGTEYTPVTDEQGRPQFAYCVEGAVNQAAINVLPGELAIQLGAASGAKKWGGLDPAHDSKFIEYLSVNDVARLIFAEVLSEREEEFAELHDEGTNPIHTSPAMVINDLDFELSDDPDATKELAYERVREMLKKRLKQLTH